MSKIYIYPEKHLYLEGLTQSILSNGWNITDQNSAEILLFLGDAQQGFSFQEIRQLDAQLQERFSGAELLLQARANAFARIRCGLNHQNQLIIATPMDDNLYLRLLRLIQTFVGLKPLSFEEKIQAIDLPTTASEKPEIIAEKIMPNQESEVKVQTDHPEMRDSTFDNPNLTQQNQQTLWQEKMAKWGIEISERSTALPPELDHPAIRQVLQNSQAMHKGTFTTESEWSKYADCILIAFPNFTSPNSKVLCVTSDGGAIALHRRQPTAILSPMVKNLLFSHEPVTPLWHDKYTGKGELFAVESNQVYFKEIHSSGIPKMSTIHSWDQRKIRTEGPLFSAIASLILQWSSR